MRLIILLIIAVIFSVSGDLACRYGAQREGFPIGWMILTAICWGGAGSVLWTMIYRSRSISEMVIIYNPLHSVLLALAGILFFNEELSVRKIIAGACALVSLLLMI